MYILFFLSLIFCDELKFEDNVLVITDKNFNQTLEQYPDLLVEFYNLQFKNHEKFLPEYIEAANYLKENDFSLVLGKVLKNNNPEISQLYSERTDPSFAYFRNGIQQNITTRDINQEIKVNLGGKILQWIKRQVGNDSIELTSEDMIYQIAEDRIVVAYFGENDEDFYTFQDVSQQYPMKVQFVHSFDKELKQRIGGFKIVVFKRFEDYKNEFREKYEYFTLLKFLDYHTRQAVIGPQFGFNHAFVRNDPVLFMIYGTDGEQNRASVLEFKKACITLKPYIIMSVVDLNSEFGYFFNQKMNEEVEEKPVFILIFQNNKYQRKYRMLRENTAENIINFFNQYKPEITNLQKSLYWESSVNINEQDNKKQDL